MRRGAWRPLVVCAAGGFLAAGCATKRPPLDLAALRASQPRTIVVAQARSPALTAEGPAMEGLMGPAWVVGGIVGVAAASSYGETVNRRRARFMKQCEIDDPIVQIRDDVAETLAGVLSIEVVDQERDTKATNPVDVVKDHPGADLILDVRTSKWGIDRVEARSARGEVHFAALYEGSFRLIDARKGAVVAETTCVMRFKYGDGAPTLNELFEDDCARLKKGLAVSAHTCAKRYRTRALGLD